MSRHSTWSGFKCCILFSVSCDGFTRFSFILSDSGVEKKRLIDDLTQLVRVDIWYDTYKTRNTKLLHLVTYIVSTMNNG